MSPGNPAQPDQSPLGASCQASYTAPSGAMANISSRPSALVATAGLPCQVPPWGSQPVQLHAPRLVVTSHRVSPLTQVSAVRALLVIGFEALMVVS